jgi:hypothetical protein
MAVRIHYPLAQVRDSANQFTKRNMGGKDGVNLNPGNAPEQAVTRFRGQVLLQHWCKHPLFDGTGVCTAVKQLTVR